MLIGFVRSEPQNFVQNVKCEFSFWPKEWGYGVCQKKLLVIAATRSTATP